MKTSGGKPTFYQSSWQPFSGKNYSVLKEWGGGYHQEDAMQVQVQRRWKRRRPKKKWLDKIKEDTKEYNMIEEMAENRSVCHMKIRPANYYMEEAYMWEIGLYLYRTTL